VPAETGKIAHIAGALKILVFAQKSQFFFSIFEVKSVVGFYRESLF